MGRSYSTAFPSTENPISEGGKWVNGGTTGLDWHNVRSDGTKCYGTQTGANGFDDSVAVLSGLGSWDATQVVTATVKTANRITAGVTTHVFEEVELLLRFTIGAHSATGYECTFSVDPLNEYIQINRWNGALGGFTLIASASSTLDTVSDGDVVKATICGSHICVYVNDVLVVQVDDATYSSGSPGVGFYFTNDGTAGTAPFVVSDFGLTNVSATNFKWAYSGCHLESVGGFSGANFNAGNLNAAPPAGAKVFAAVLSSQANHTFPSISKIVDSSGVAWSRDSNPFTNDNGTYCEEQSWWSCIASGAAMNSITVTATPAPVAAQGVAVVVAAFGGISAALGALGQDFAQAAVGTTSPFTSGASTGTTDRSDELKLAAYFDAGNNATIALSSPDANLTLIGKVDNSAASEAALAYGPAGNAGVSAQATFTSTVNADSVVAVAVYRSIEPSNSVRETHAKFPKMNMRANPLRPAVK